LRATGLDQRISQLLRPVFYLQLVIEVFAIHQLELNPKFSSPTEARLIELNQRQQEERGEE
jgi:hypothetical protein